MKGFSDGFRLGYEGVSSVQKSVQLNLAAVHEELQELGRIAGPFSSRPLENLRVSPIGLIPKADPEKLRLIQHLSYPEGDSINDGIDQFYCNVNYASFDVAVGLVSGIGQGGG